MWAKSAVMHSAFWLLATLLALTLETLETHGKKYGGADILKNQRTSSESVTQSKRHSEHGSDHKLSDEAKKSGGHHSEHKAFKLKKFHKHTKTSHKHGHHNGTLPQSSKGKIGKEKDKKGKKKKVHKKHKKKTHHHKRTRTRRHKKHTKKHGKHGCKGEKIVIKEDPFCQDKNHKNHCRWPNCIYFPYPRDIIPPFTTMVAKI